MADDQNLDAEAVDEAASLDWVPEKFRSNPQELAKAYENLEREYHNSRQQVKGLEDSIGTLSSQFEEFVAAQNAPDPAEVEAQWENAYTVDPWSTTRQYLDSQLQQIVQAQAQVQQQPTVTPDVTAFIADQNMANTHEDWGHYKAQVAELVQSDPLFANDSLWSNPQHATTALDRAYKMVKAESVLSGDDVVRQQLADTRQMKLNAQSATGAAGRPESPDANANRWQEIVNAPTGKLDFS